ncbi:endonuclease/exonuclease/phosphatase family protein [Salinimicrobium sp. GXAS 041]|uniref:endonuclease/exonuclease/phosphatase family protein n=1 Tax=Salinimicrobium sp. GXAS 041 TaxID=3400806 RepID=UPI003C70931A
MKPCQTCGVFLLLFLFKLSVFSQEKKDFQIQTIAFYNLENLYDTEDDPVTYDDDRTPQGKDNWTEEIYRDKLQKMAFAIRNIGSNMVRNPPVLLGVCEVENRKVLEDLINEPHLKDFNYGIVHYDSPDRRGIDVALLYLKNAFSPLHSKAHELFIFEDGKRVYTRDQLVVTGLLEGEEIHLIVNHWPSRSGGTAASSPKRIEAAKLNLKIIDSLQRKDPYAKIISMGDFNDDPTDKSLKKTLRAKMSIGDVNLKEMYNPMAAIFSRGIGSSAYRDGWNLFDQILISQPFLKDDYETYRFFKAGVGNATYLTTSTGQYKGYPFRSFGYGGYTGGYSDHFPVYIYLIRDKKITSSIPERGN